MSGLDPFYNNFNNPANIVMGAFGDSTTEGNVAVSNGGWVEQLRILADPRWPRGSDGTHPFNRDPWTTTSGVDAWTGSTTSDVWDCQPCLGGVGLYQATWLGNTATKIATWTKPGSLTVEAFTIYAVDGPSSANFSYSVDNGAWTNVSITWNQDNTIKQIKIAMAVTNTVRIRGANSSGTARNAYIMGLEPTRRGPGWIIHNFGNNADFGFNLTRSTAGNGHAWFDLVQPSLCTWMYTNDAIFYDSATYQSNMSTFADMVIGYGGSVLFMNFFEQPGRAAAMTGMRADLKTVAANYNMPYIDFYDLVGDNAAAIAAGYMNAADLHPNNAGAVFMAQEIWKVISKSGIGAKRRIS